MDLHVRLKQQKAAEVDRTVKTVIRGKSVTMEHLKMLFL